MADAPPLTIFIARVGSPDYEQFTLPFIERYCGKYGYNLRFITDPPADGRHPSWQKLLAAESHCWGPLLVMDLDMLPLPWAAPIHEHVHRRRITLSRSGFSLRATRKFRRLGIDDEFHYNDSYIGLPAAYGSPFPQDAPMRQFVSRVYRETSDPAGLPYDEMAALCRAIQRQSAVCRVHVVPPRFDVQIIKGDIDSQLERIKQSDHDILHFAGRGGSHKVDAARAAWERWSYCL